jgi:hypothetical protein
MKVPLKNVFYLFSLNTNGTKHWYSIENIVISCFWNKHIQYTVNPAQLSVDLF